MQPNLKTPLVEYHYDALNRLVASTPSVQATTQRFYLKDHLATEIQGTEQSSIMQHDDQLLAQQQRQGSAAAQSSFLAADHQRSVLTLLDAKQPHTFVYTPYGHCFTGGGLLSLLGFKGERQDPLTGWYLLGNGYRAFSPLLMRFHSPDSVRLSPFGRGGLNAYAYCLGDPVNRADRNGHFSRWAIVRSNLPSIVKMRASSKTLATPWGNAIPGTAKRVSPTPDLRPRTSLNHMPEKILAKIFDQLDGKDLINVSLTSKRMKAGVSRLSAINLNKQLAGKLPSEHLPLIDAVGFGEIKGIAPSAAINTGVTIAQAQRDFPYAMTRLVGPNNRSMHYGPRPDLLPQVDPPQNVAAQIRAMHGDLF
ncbi:RHS repeat-associated core domain-containing protein [Pseudomonas sp. Irchel 3A7]|uniref:RHS repeat-associated core domain-containing protein n=1 Tax=Pseudomonas sp. Irchel 3A7 TaxID=2008913 RepID=UPI000BA37172|nr:RHS repeat-associated core domain-containing protein [Pseudomonas sp. Irchel 3A7]